MFAHSGSPRVWLEGGRMGAAFNATEKGDDQEPERRAEAAPSLPPVFQSLPWLSVRALLTLARKLMGSKPLNSQGQEAQCGVPCHGHSSPQT